jgi:hypothetical protein
MASSNDTNFCDAASPPGDETADPVTATVPTPTRKNTDKEPAMFGTNPNDATKLLVLPMQNE